MGPRPRQSLIVRLFEMAFAFADSMPSFGMQYGSNPKAYNGGTRSGAAAIQRAARKRRNVRARSSKRHG